MLNRVGRAKRRSNPRARQGQPGQRQQAAAPPPGPAKRLSGLSSPQVLERIERTKVVQQEAEGELAVLVDHAVILGIGWPEIALRLGVTRQAARQHYQRRHRRERDSATQQNRSN